MEQRKRKNKEKKYIFLSNMTLAHVASNEGEHGEYYHYSLDVVMQLCEGVECTAVHHAERSETDRQDPC